MMNKITTNWQTQFIADGAAIEHARWSKWQKYMFSKGTLNNDGSWTLPKEYVDRWTTQANTEYADLSEEERESDREEVRSYLPLVRSIVGE